MTYWDEEKLQEEFDILKQELEKVKLERDSEERWAESYHKSLLEKQKTEGYIEFIEQYCIDNDYIFNMMYIPNTKRTFSSWYVWIDCPDNVQHVIFGSDPNTDVGFQSLEWGIECLYNEIIEEEKNE